MNPPKLNPNILPGTQVPSEEHLRLMRAGIWAAMAIAIIGIMYVWQMDQQTPGHYGAINSNGAWVLAATNPTP